MCHIISVNEEKKRGSILEGERTLVLVTICISIDLKISVEKKRSFILSGTRISFLEKVSRQIADDRPWRRSTVFLLFTSHFSGSLFLNH